MKFQVVQPGNLFKTGRVAQLSESHLLDYKKSALIYSKVKRSYSHRTYLSKTRCGIYIIKSEAVENVYINIYKHTYKCQLHRTKNRMVKI